MSTEEISKKLTLYGVYHLKWVVSVALVLPRWGIINRWLLVLPSCRLRVVVWRWIVFILLGFISVNKISTKRN